MEKCLLCLFPVRSQFLDFIKWMHGFRCIFFWVTVKSNYNQTICATIVFCFPVSCRLEYIRFHRVQTKGKRFSHHEQWCEFWVHTFMYIFTICPVEHLLSWRSIDLILCFYFHSNVLLWILNLLWLAGGFSWPVCLGLWWTPDACRHEEGSRLLAWFLILMFY